MIDHSPPQTSTPSPWENLDKALSRLESAILTQKQNNTTNDTSKDTQQTEQLLQQNAQLKTALHQALMTLKKILNA